MAVVEIIIFIPYRLYINGIYLLPIRRKMFMSNFGTKALSKILDFFNNITSKEYEELYEEAEKCDDDTSIDTDTLYKDVSKPKTYVCAKDNVIYTKYDFTRTNGRIVMVGGIHVFVPYDDEDVKDKEFKHVL